MDVWFGTKSSITCMPSRCATSTMCLNAAGGPQLGSRSKYPVIRYSSPNIRRSAGGHSHRASTPSRFRYGSRRSMALGPPFPHSSGIGA